MAKKKASGLLTELKEETKKNWKKIIFLVVFALIIVIGTLFFVGNSLSFSIKEELNIILTPKTESIITQYDTAHEATFSFLTDNFPWCDAQCTYQLKDISNNKVLDKHHVAMTKGQAQTANYTLSAGEVGAGQKIYSFEVECNNVRTLLCRTKEKKTFESSFITLNYDLSEAEKTIKTEVGDKIKKDLTLIQEIDTTIYRNDELIARLFHSNEAKELFTRHTVAQNKINTLKTNFNELRNLFDDQKFVILDQEYATINYKDITNLDIDATKIAADILAQLNKYNDLVTEYTELLSDTRWNDVASFYNTPDITLSYNQHYSDYDTLRNDNFVTLNNFHPEFESIYQTYLDENQDNLISLNINNSRMKFVIESIKNNKTTSFTNITYEEKKQLCNETGILLAQINELNARNITFNLSHQEYLENEFNKNLDNQTKTLLNIEIKNLTIPNSSTSLSKIIPNLYCTFIEKDILKNVTKTLLETSIPTTASDFSTLLNDRQPQCCVFNNCRPCCTPETCNDERLYPVIFIHGHSFDQSEKPQSSVKMFANMQNKLVEEGFINAGEVDLSSRGEYGYWGRSGYPVGVRATYYYITYHDVGILALSTQKSDRIENYALRLREIVDFVKYKTGAKKVNIIAHSMGGLVAREYINIFGGQNVNKFVMIATPNNGVAKSRERLCKLTGSNPECEDMTENSIFLKRLNAEWKTPENIKMYNIIGQGCNTAGDVGDGVVTIDSAYLEGAKTFYVEGVCTDFSGIGMHNNMINPYIYPDVYSKVVEVLKD